MASAIKMEDEGEDGTTEEEEFNLKQQVWMYERQAVLSMYTPPSANQSWRKALSMGNLLKGHKAVVREIIFSMQDSMTHDHHGIAGSPTRILKHIECTYVEHPIIFCYSCHNETGYKHKGGRVKEESNLQLLQ